MKVKNTMAAHDGAVVPEEEMWPSPFSNHAAPPFKYEVPKKKTKGEKKERLRILKNDKVKNVKKSGIKCKNNTFRPSQFSKLKSPKKMSPKKLPPVTP